MLCIRGLERRLSRYLAAKLGGLNTTLSDLGQHLRAAIVSRVADHLARVVQEAIEASLAEPDPDPMPSRMTFRNTLDPRQQPDDPSPSSYQSGLRGNLFGGYHDEADLDDEEALEPQPILPVPSIQQPRLRVAVITGLRASVWCLGRRGSGSLLTALAIGLSASAVALFGGPMLAAGAATVCSLLALTG